ncbi:MAG: amino acid adenylation domain-containing protein [bacterium]|nr:amino acid adenylation domain-containing protein [bacterium]
MDSKDSILNANFNEFDPFSGAEIINIIPTTESQMEIWLSCAIGGDDANRGFNESISLKFDGELNIKAFEESLLSIVYRHEALHSAFSLDGSKMMVFKEVPFNYKYEDLSNLDNVIQKNKIKQSIDSDALFVFDLLNGPLFKFSLYKLSNSSFFFIFNAHHIVCDGWSLGVILQDLSKFYNAYCNNTLPELKEPDSFSQYAMEQSEFVNGTIYSDNLKYWVNKHQNIVPDLNLPFDFIRPFKKTYTSKRIDNIIDINLLNKLKSIGIKEGCSMVNTLLAAFELFLSQITGQKDIIVGLPAADQSATGRFNLVGHCVNLLPLKSRINDELNFLEYLKYRKSEILDAYEHQQFTFGSLLKNLKIERDPSRVPLLPVVFNVDMEMDQGVSFRDLDFETISNVKAFRNFEFSLNIWGSEKNLQLEWSYNNQLFERSTIEKIMRDFELLLHSIVSNPEQKLEQLLRQNPIQVLSKLKESVITTQTSEIDLSRNYYLELFSGELSVLDFPFDKSRNGFSEHTLGQLSLVFSSDHFTELLQFATSHNTSISVILLSLVDVLLYRYTGEQELIIGFKSPSHKTMALRQHISSENSFYDVLSQTELGVNEGIKHQQYTLPNLLRDLSLAPHTSRNGLFDIKISIEDSVQDNTIDYSAESVGIQDLDFRFHKTQEGLSIDLIYNQSLIELSSAERILTHLVSLLHDLISKPSEPIKAIDYLSSAERLELLETFNNTTTDYPRASTVTGLFELQVSQTPENTALVYEDKRYSYSELNAVSNQFGAFLRSEYAIGADDLIGIELERSEWLIISILGVLKSGGAYVPIDPSYPQERIEYLKSNSQCKVVIDSGLLLKFQTHISNYSTSNLISINKSSDLVYVIYTSGSTGQPKGVMVEHKNMVNYTTWFINQFNIGIQDATILLSSFTFDGVNTSIFGALLAGSTLFVLSSELIKSPRDLANYVNQNKISFIKITPSHLNLILSDEESYKFFIASLKLRLLIVGGDKINAIDISKIKKDNKSIQIINHYGPTETTVGVIFSEIKKSDNKIPIGSPISNTIIYLFDSNYKLCPIGVYGEIYIGGDSVTRGYLYNSSLTLEKFIDNPFNTGERLYKTGDSAKWLENGQIDFQGRKDFQLKIRGYRVEAGEIESIVNTYPGIERSIVISKGEDENQFLIAFIVANKTIDITDLRKYIDAKLPAFMVPSFFEQLAEIPLSPSGKINRTLLLQHKINRTISSINILSTSEEEIVARIWSDLLKIENISKTANFFELGGHSLIAIRVVIRLENETGIKLPMSTLFEYPTIEKLGKLLERNEVVKQWKSLVPIKNKGKKVPLYIVHGGGLGVMVFHHLSKYLDNEQPLFGLQALGIDGQEEPLTSIEEMSSFYLSEIFEQNPEGPYSLAGHSSGGLIAFEMAQQLKALGKVVKSLTVFDFNIAEAKRTYSIREKLGRQVKFFFPILIFSIKSIFKQPIRTFKYYILLWKLRFISMKSRLGIKPNSEMNTVFLNIDNVIHKNTEAIRAYNPLPYKGNLNLFVSSDKVNFQEDPVYLGWKVFIKGEIFRHDAKGDHDEMIMPPNIITFASEFQKILDLNQ